MIDNERAAELNVVLSDVAHGIVVYLIGLQEVVLDGLAVKATTERGKSRHIDSRGEETLRDSKGKIFRRRVDSRRGQLAIRIAAVIAKAGRIGRSEEHTSELQSRSDIVCRLLLAKKSRSEPSLC